MAKKRKATPSHVLVVKDETLLPGNSGRSPWAYFKPQVTDKDIFDSHIKAMKRNARKDRWMLEK